MNSIYKKLTQIEKSGEQAALCIVIESNGSTPRKASAKMIVYENGTIFGTIGGGNLEHLVTQEALKTIETQKPGIFDYNLILDANMNCGGFAKVYIEPIETQKQLFIFGAGHIGAFLAKISLELGFNVTLIDEREEIFNKLSDANINTINKSHNDAFNELTFNKNTFICVATHNHKYDSEIVAYCAKQAYGYLGMIGSKNKIAKIRSAYLENNILNESEMENINWPMGVNIKCETPQEIAISILAKLVDVKVSKNKIK
ncbi:MAG: XdhC family protein [Salinivirgaceae bacterium]|nr:XdhC family protein [Salinivirgaceae bacterium]